MRPARAALALAMLLLPLGPALPGASLPVDTGLGPEVYHNWAYLTADLAALSVLHPDLARWNSAGRSTAGLDLWVLEIGHFATQTGTEPVVVLDGGHHGNEPLGLELVYALAVRLLTTYGDDAQATRIVDATRLFIVPSVNPDGNLLDTRKNLMQVDLNRNYPFHWGEPGCSHTIIGATYCGPSPASEAEVQVMLAFLGDVRPDLYVSGHTGTTALIYPWSYTTLAPPDAARYESICAGWRAQTGIRCGQASRELYIASGTSKDWAYATLGTVSFTFEVNGEQNLPLSVQDIETRLAAPIRGMLWLLDNAGPLTS